MSGTSRRPRRRSTVPRRHEAGLERGVVLHAAVPVEMVGRDVEQHADRGAERRRQLDLERRHLDDVDALGGWRRQLQDGGADVAAHLRIPACGAKNVGDERRGGRLAVGAGDRNERRFRTALRPLAAEKLDIADDLHPGGVRLGDRPMRRGMGQRHARRQHRAANRPVGTRQIFTVNPPRPLRRPPHVAGGNRRSPQAMAGRQRTCRDEDRHAAGKCRDRNHAAILSRVGGS
jgi:hypothetical protein